MSELDRWGDSAATALLDEVTGAETEEALAVVRGGGTRRNDDRPRWGLLALAAAAVIVLVGGVAVIKSRDTDEVEPPLATPPSTSPATTPVPTSVPATAPETIPATSVETTPPSTVPATSAPVTEPPATTASTPSTPPSVAPLAEQPGFGGASTVAYASGGVIIVSGTRQDGSPVLWEWSDGTGAWSAVDLPGDNSFVPIAFLDDEIGYAFVDGYLQKTSDSGQTWGRVDIASPSGSGISVIGIAIGAGHVHVLAVDQDGAMTFRLYTMPIDGESFTATSVEFPPPAGGEPSASFAFDDQTGWMAVTSRTLMGAAHFADGEWTEAPDVTCVNGGVYFVSSGVSGDFVRACDSGFMGSDGSIPEGTQLEVSSDGGRTYRPVPIADRSPDTPEFVTLLARPVPGTIVIRAQDGSGVVFDDEGGDGTPLNLPTGSFVSELEARGGDIAVAIGSTSNGDQRVWVSRDAGVTWAG